MLRFMLDTDICSYIMKRSSPAVLSRFAVSLLEELCVSAIVRSELEFGVACSPKSRKDRGELERFLENIAVLDFPGQAAPGYGNLRAWLKSNGTPIGANDMLIAAHARYLGLTLVTNNVREFQRVPGLNIENWAEPTS